MFGRESLVALAVAGAVLVAPASASAQTWAWPVTGAVALAYGAAWTDASGGACTHGGVDIAAPSGTRVSACAGGRVTFAGRVPAFGGGNTLAVSVVTAEGLKYTCMPLADLAVAPGDDVNPGDALGSLGAAGDGSGAAPHLHLTVRRGEATIDPLALLGAPAPPAAATPEVVPPAVPGASLPRPARTAPVATAPAVQSPRAVAAGRSPADALSGVPAGAPTAADVRAALSRAVPPAPAGFARRIGPVAGSASIDPAAVAAAARSWTLTSGGLALKGMLLALALLLMAPVLRRLLRAAAESAGAVAVPAVARVPRSARRPAR